LKTVAIIAAGGRGERVVKSATTEQAKNLPKQFVMLGDKPLLAHTIERFERCELVDQIVVVAPEDYLGYCSQKVVDKYSFGKVKKIVSGGEERQDSVFLGLKACPPDTSTVAIHDGVRPFVSTEKISEAILLCEQKRAVILAVPAKDTIKRVEDRAVVTTLDREKLWLVQTPQVFEYNLICEAYRKAEEDGFLGTDDSILVERLGFKVAVLEGEYENMKITTPEDIALAEKLLQIRRKI